MIRAGCPVFYLWRLDGDESIADAFRLVRIDKAGMGNVPCERVPHIVLERQGQQSPS
ncbi:MAG: hypothetical protein LBV45_03070 [Xanthomonadaceae bacterium]|jgi:hypothetical protein|nr:hypothetical protein [Xanthomonadaceae bacterium]